MQTHVRKDNPNIYEFVSSQSNHKIIVELDLTNNEALINTIHINNEACAPVELALLLKYMCNELNKINIKKIIQQIYESDWNASVKKNKLFTLVNKNEKYNFLNISCDINNFPLAFMTEMGF